jgi:hypothetical protein
MAVGTPTLITVLMMTAPVTVMLPIGLRVGFAETMGSARTAAPGCALLFGRFVGIATGRVPVGS